MPKLKAFIASNTPPVPFVIPNAKPSSKNSPISKKTFEGEAMPAAALAAATTWPTAAAAAAAALEAAAIIPFAKPYIRATPAP